MTDTQDLYPSKALMEVNNLSIFLLKANQRLALVDQVTFNLYRGKTSALVGESGSGKSLTAQALMGLIPFHAHLEASGSIVLDGRELLSQSPEQWAKLRGHRLAFISQNPMQALNPVLTIGQQLVETALHHTTHDEEEAYEYCIETLKKVKLSEPHERMKDYPHQLSGGMRQRVLIAMALLGCPDVLIADEPTTALDISVQRQILDLFHEIQQEQQMAILLISHDISIVSHYADDILVMYASQLVEKGPCTEVLELPKHPYTQGLLESRPKWESSSRQLMPIQGNVPAPGTLISGCRFYPRCPQSLESCKHCPPKGPPLYKVGENHYSRCILHENQQTSH
jgi:peptide/nickel transport system ATP-binding protein